MTKRHQKKYYRYIDTKNTHIKKTYEKYTKIKKLNQKYTKLKNTQI